MSKVVDALFSENKRALISKEQIYESITLYGTRKSVEMNELIKAFEEHWKIGLWLDSMVSENDKCFFYFMTFKCSNRDEVINEIKKYLKFYEKLSNIGSIKNANDYESLLSAKTIIQNVQHELLCMVEKALAEISTTSSFAVYKLHGSILAKKKELTMKLVSIEYIISREASQESAKVFCKNFEDTVNVVKKLHDQINDLQQQNRVLQQENKDIADKLNNKHMDENIKFREEIRDFIFQVSYMRKIKRKANKIM